MNEVNEPKPVQLATRYLKKQWEFIYGHGCPVPFDLVDAVVVTTMATGYSRDVVDKLIRGYIAKPTGE